MEWINNDKGHIVYKPKVLVTAPVGTRSGYGSRSRDITRALINMNEYDVIVNPVPWGNTPQNALVLDDPEDRKIIDRFITEEFEPDIHIHIVVPNEFTPLGKYNIGITAGLEATAIPQSWIDGINRMNLVLASSNFSAEVMRSTQYTHNESGQILKANTPIVVLFEGADLQKFKRTNSCSKVLADHMKTVKEDWNFLFVGHWLQGAIGDDRKDVGTLVRMFLEQFKSKERVGLILKTSGATTSVMDRADILDKIDIIRTAVDNDDLPNIYLLHADLFDSEMNDLYNHPKVKAHITLTHGEGFGRPLLEACLSEKPVMAPNFSGHVDFLHPKHSILLPGAVTQVSKSSFQEGLYVEGMSWFTANLEHTVKMMRGVRANYRKYKLSAKKLAKINRVKFSMGAMQNKLQTLLKSNLPTFTETVAVDLPKLKLPKLKKVTTGVPKLKLPKLKKVKE